MSTDELAKTYDPAAVEAETYRVWLDEKCFEADPAGKGEPYSIVIPPPNVTGALHLGHAINNTLQDILTRVHRMRGFNTVWIPGIDHAGIATQAVVEKQLKEKENKTRHDVGREALVARIWQWKQQYGDRILSQLQRLGCSCDWSRTRFTLDEMCARAVRETFFKLFKDGLVYRGKRLVNWDAHLQTSISDDEIYHETIKTFLWHIKYPIVPSPSPGTPGEGRGEGDFERKTTLDEPNHPHPTMPELIEDRERGPEARATHMIVATTRPETLLGDTAVAVHSQDPRWNWAIGQFVELPLTGRKIPIIADDILVDMAFGSGVVKVTPGHDPNDYAVYTRHLGKPDEIAIINLLNPDGTLNENAGKYAGLKRDSARKAVVKDLGDLLVKEEPYETQVGHSDRSKTPVEPYLSDQWFVKMAPLAEPALDVVRDGTIKFFPERHAQQYLSWLGEKRDWPISRQLWWGHRIPVWSKTEEYEEVDPPHGTRSSSNSSSIVSYCERTGVNEMTTYACVPAGDPKAEQYLERAGFTQDPDVLDTWFSSALWPHSTLGWPDRTADLARWYPTSVLMTGRDIITLWVARMVMMGMYNMGSAPSPGTPGEGRGEGDLERQSALDKPNHPHPNPLPEYRERGPERGIPFHHVAINPTILDGNGERMAKQKGNGVDPVDVIDSHGADALRFTLTMMATETQEARLPIQLTCPHCTAKMPNPASEAQTAKCPKCGKLYTRALGTNVGTTEAPLAKPTSEKFDLGRNFSTKLWNAAKFVLSNLESVKPRPVVAEGNADSPVTDSISAPGATTGRGFTLADQWIVSRFNRAVDETNAALENYRFDQYAKTCYDFFWRDFCDWYVEAAKPAIKDPARSAATANTLATMLDGILRLMHPMIPFITERLWWKLNEIRPAGRSKRLVLAQWPITGPINDSAEQTFGILQEIIVAIRNVRNQYKIDPKKPVAVSLSVPDNFKSEISNNRELIETLAICTISKTQADLPMPANSARAIVGGIEIFVEGVIDPDAEKARDAKKKETLTREREALIARLANPSYADKAPAHLVQQTRDKLAAVEAELAKLQS